MKGHCGVLSLCLSDSKICLFHTFLHSFRHICCFFRIAVLSMGHRLKVINAQLQDNGHKIKDRFSSFNSMAKNNKDIVKSIEEDMYSYINNLMPLVDKKGVIKSMSINRDQWATANDISEMCIRDMLKTRAGLKISSDLTAITDFIDISYRVFIFNIVKTIEDKIKIENFDIVLDVNDKIKMNDFYLTISLNQSVIKNYHIFNNKKDNKKVVMKIVGVTVDTFRGHNAPLFISTRDYLAVKEKYYTLTQRNLEKYNAFFAAIFSNTFSEININGIFVPKKIGRNAIIGEVVRYPEQHYYHTLAGLVMNKMHSSGRYEKNMEKLWIDFVILSSLFMIEHPLEPSIELES